MASSILVAAIDFGTTYSGWAYSFEHEYRREPTKVSAKNWSGGKLVSEKAPTTVLIEPDGRKLRAFGYEAEDMYAELAEKEEHKKWYYYRRFKMLLMDKLALDRTITMEDATGKKLPAKMVFSMVIKYLKDDLLEECNSRITGLVQPDEIMWVLTVPAIWNDSAKQFMREAAVEAGINANKLKVALEPETASLFCRHLPIDRMVGKIGISSMTEGSKYMVIDAGGGTIDITVHQILKEGKLKEVHQASGGAWGGTKVDEAYRQFLISIVGNSVFQQFVNKHMEDYIDMTREFEIKKRKVYPMKEENDKGADANITLRFPLALTEIFKEVTGEDIGDAVRQTKFSGLIQLSRDKLRVDAEIMRSFFSEATKSIVEHVMKLLTQSTARDVSDILMVGGFSESKMLQDAIRRNFPAKRIVVPQEAGLVVLKGAVVFGHDPVTIMARLAKYTYGISRREQFIEGEHDERNMIVEKDGRKTCRGIFIKYAEIGQILKHGEDVQVAGYIPASIEQPCMQIKLFASTEKTPKYVTNEGCFKIGEMTVDVSTAVPHDKREVIVSLTFGDTEIHMKAFEKSTGKETTCSLSFLE